jgi:hypothetical protein
VVADVPFVGFSRSFDGREKKLPNINVAIEIGYAGRAVGWERMIVVMNGAYGDADEQVFDLKRHRNPITFDVPADGGPGQGLGLNEGNGLPPLLTGAGQPIT